MVVITAVLHVFRTVGRDAGPYGEGRGPGAPGPVVASRGVSSHRGDPGGKLTRMLRNAFVLCGMNGRIVASCIHSSCVGPSRIVANTTSAKEINANNP